MPNIPALIFDEKLIIIMLLDIDKSAQKILLCPSAIRRNISLVITFYLNSFYLII